MEAFSFSPLKNLAEEEKWLISVTSFETTHSIFNITNENSSFPNTVPSLWTSRWGAETINELREIL